MLETGPEPSHSLQLLPAKHCDAKDDHSSVITVKTIESLPIALRITVNPEFLTAESSDGFIHQDIIVIPPSSSDLSDASIHSAPASLCTNMSLNDNTLATLNLTPTEISFVPTCSHDDIENKSPPSKQIGSAASYNSLVDIDMVDHEEKDTFDHIRTTSAGVEFQRKHNPRLTFDHRPSFGATIDNVEWFRASHDRRRCPRGGWLTRIAKSNDGNMEPSSSGIDATLASPPSDVYRNSRGFTFQC